MKQTTFGNRLKEARIRRGMKQYELSQAVGITGASLSQMEKGKSGASGSTIFKLCTVLDVSADYLLGLPGRTITREQIQQMVQAEAGDIVESVLNKINVR